MNVTTSYPGVYLSEDATPSFSVNTSPTAVPIFAADDAAIDDIQVFNSWAEFATSYSASSEGYFYNSIKLWFMNGGGKCYLADSGDIADAVAKNDDITLLVSTGVDILEQFSFIANQGMCIFALFDTEDKKLDAQSNVDDVMADFPPSAYGAVFYPWATLTSGDVIPPSAVAAAAIAQTDASRGVWKAPANQAVNGVTPKYPVSDELQGRFNQGKALNMIRTFSGTGTVVWGARTLQDDDNWRYIPVRRLFNAVERDIQNSLNKMVFEPNSQPTWQRVKAAVDSYLHGLWKQGALSGNTPAEAWFVQIGKDITMTTDDINQGKMIVKVGLAAVRPAEFIILQFSQDIAQ